MVALTLYSALNFLSLSWCICSTRSGNWANGMALRPVTGRGDKAKFHLVVIGSLSSYLCPLQLGLFISMSSSASFFIVAMGSGLTFTCFLLLLDPRSPDQ